jgi:hypothetical protein
MNSRRLLIISLLSFSLIPIVNAGAADKSINKAAIIKEKLKQLKSSDLLERLNAADYIRLYVGAAEDGSEQIIKPEDFWNDKTISALIDALLTEENDAVESSLLASIHTRLDKRFIPPLREILYGQQKSLTMKMEIAYTLAIQGDKAIVPYLAEHITDYGGRRDLAVRGLTRIKNDETTRLLIKAVYNGYVESSILNELRKRNAKDFNHILEKIIAGRDDSSASTAMRILMEIKETYFEECLAKGDEFELQVLGRVLSVPLTTPKGRTLSADTLIELVMNRQIDATIRKNALFSLRTGHYWNINYIKYLDYNKPFYAFLTNTVADTHANDGLQDEAQKLLQDFENTKTHQ